MLVVGQETLQEIKDVKTDNFDIILTMIIYSSTPYTIIISSVGLHTWKNLSAVSCSFCREKQLPTTHHVCGEYRSKSLTFCARYDSSTCQRHVQRWQQGRSSYNGRKEGAL